MKTYFYIFRHGQTIWNAEGRPQGQTPYPVPLTMLGQEQSETLAQKLIDKNIAVIISSDFLRAQQTAEIVAKKLNVEIVYTPDLREMNYGKLNGLYAIEREEVFPDYHKCYEDLSFPFPDGESFKQAAERLSQVIIDTAHKYRGKNVAISTHGNIIDGFLEVTFHKKLQKVGTGNFVVIGYDDENRSFDAVQVPEEFSFSR